MQGQLAPLLACCREPLSCGRNSTYVIIECKLSNKKYN